MASGSNPLAVGTNVDGEERRLRQALRNQQSPLAECYFVWIASSAGIFAAVVVPPSVRAPHAVLGLPGDNTKPLRYPSRHGADTMWLTEPEVADRYRRRLQSAEDHATSTAALIQTANGLLPRDTGLWLYGAVIPEFEAAPDRLDKQVVAQIDGWFHQNGIGSPLDRSLRAHGRGIPAPGRVTFTGSRSYGSENETDVRDAYVELRLTGSAYAATPLGLHTDDEDPAARAVGERTLVDDLMLILDVTLRWSAERAGAYGTATVIAGLVDTATVDGRLGEPVAYRHFDSRGPSTSTRRLTGAPSSTAIADLAAVSTIQERLAVTYQGLSATAARAIWEG